jgi:tRNA(Leu) C34 or U34 (ribose-2'-O)-methylase TrmL
MNDNFITEYFGRHTKRKNTENLGVLWRGSKLRASYIFTIGNRYAKQSSDTHNAVKSIPYFHYETFEDFYKTQRCTFSRGRTWWYRGRSRNFRTPRRCVYLLGAEDNGLSKKRSKMPSFSQIQVGEKFECVCCRSIVLYDRGLNKPRS